MGTIILSAIVAHTGWHWMTERWEHLRQFRFEWPMLTAALLAGAMRWTAAILLLAGVLWMLFRLLAPARGAERSERENTV
jgi:TRAP-type C4-dicarboxylate transport system permease small subunit